MVNSPIRTRLLELRAAARDCQLQLAAQLAGCGVWTLEPDTGELTLSAHCLALLDLAPDAHPDFDALLELAHGEDRAHLRRAFAEALRVRDEFTLRFDLTRADGSLKPLRLTGRPHASALRPDQYALSGVLQALVPGRAEAAFAATPRIGAMLNHLERLHELERSTFAARLRTEVAPQLDALRTRLETLASGIDLTPAVRRELLAVAGAADTWLDGLRTVIFEMLPPGVDELGLAGAVERYATEQAAAGGIELSLSLPVEPLALAVPALKALYAAARTGIDNVMQHASARRMEIALACEPRRIVLRVGDDGAGIRHDDLMKRTALGLFALSERLAEAGGELRVGGRPGGGTLLEASIARPRTRLRQESRKRPSRRAMSTTGSVPSCVSRNFTTRAP